MSVTEYSMKNSHLMLFQTLDDIKNFDGIVFYSLFQLPENNITRKKILDKILKMKKEIHFSLEQMRMSCKNDLEKIEEIWKVRKNSTILSKQIMKKETQFINHLHKSISRNYLARVNKKKPKFMKNAKKVFF